MTAKIFWVCTADRDIFPDYVEAAWAELTWGFFELAAGHWPMITAPKRLIDLSEDF